MSNKTRTAQPGARASVPPATPFRSRDQFRCSHAYQCVREILEKPEVKPSYRILVNDLGITIRRHGLSACFALLERKGGNGRDGQAVALLLQHLAGSGVSVLQGVPGADIAEKVRELSLDEYMLATRELLAMAVWLKRAVQALINSEDEVTDA
ncbi:type III-B CRISPR module-associated protein Cmr5 [Insolitispirillum peregrinum]|uniref:type III-B CRISPR module-associated protein Cmr5 n=1 Tax=Insolitispirillum peregrinum TaxID=80876 RepID=UPI00360D77CC